MADTDILLSVDLDIQDAEKTAEQLQKEVKNIFDSGRGQKSAALTSLEMQMKKNYDTVNKLKQAMSELTKSDTEYSSLRQQYSSLDAELQELNKEYEALMRAKVAFAKKQGPALTEEQKQRADELQDEISKITDAMDSVQEKMLDIEPNLIPSEQFASLQKSLSDTYKEAEKIASKMKDFEASGGDVKSKKYEEWNRQLQILQERADRFNQAMEQARTSGTAFVSGKETEEYKKLQAELDGANDKLKQQLIKYNEIENKGSKSVNKTTRSVQRLGKATEQVRKSSGQVVTNLSTGLKNVNKSITRALGRFAMLFLGVRGLYSVVMKIRSAILEGFKNLRESGVGKLKQQMNDLTNASTTLKNALAGAFEPIVTSIIPRIQELIQWLTAAIDKLAQFIAAMKGQTTYIKAIKQVGDASKKANKELSKLDNLNVLTSQNANGAAGMFEEVEIPDEMLQKVEDLKAKIKAIHDWLEKHIFKPVKDFLAWLAQPITKNLDKIQKALDNFKRHLEPWIQWIQEKIQHMRDVINEVWETYIKPALNKIMGYITYFVGKLLDFYNKHSDEFAWFGEQFRAIWDESIQPVIDEAMRWLGSLFNLIASFITSGDIDSFFDGLEVWWGWLYPTLQTIVLWVRRIIKAVADMTVNIMQNTRRVFDFLAYTLDRTGSKMTTFKIFIKLLLKGIKESIKDTVNTTIRIVFWLINKIIDGFNGMVERLNQISIDIPSWIPEYGGQSFNMSLPTLSELSVPQLAQGAVIPPNNRFLAMLGDQKSGTNIEAPLDTIKQALSEVLMNGNTGTQEIVLNLDGREFMRAMVKQNNQYKKSHGGQSALA